MERIEFELDQKELVSAAFRTGARDLVQVKNIAIYGMGAGMMFVILMIVSQNLQQALTGALFVCVALLSIQLSVLALIPSTIRRKIKTNPQFGCVMGCGWDGEGLHMDISASRSMVGWPDVRAWHESKLAMLLYVDGNTFLVLPKRAFSGGQKDDLVRHLTTGNVPRKFGRSSYTARA